MIELKIVIIKKLIALIGALILTLQGGTLGAVISSEADIIIPKKEVNLNLLEAEILKKTGWQHSTPTKGGFSGLSLIALIYKATSAISLPFLVITQTKLLMFINNYSLKTLFSKIFKRINNV